MLRKLDAALTCNATAREVLHTFAGEVIHSFGSGAL